MHAERRGEARNMARLSLQPGRSIAKCVHHCQHPSELYVEGELELGPVLEPKGAASKRANAASGNRNGWCVPAFAAQRSTSKKKKGQTDARTLRFLSLAKRAPSPTKPSRGFPRLGLMGRFDDSRHTHTHTAPRPRQRPSVRKQGRAGQPKEESRAGHRRKRRPHRRQIQPKRVWCGVGFERIC